MCFDSWNLHARHRYGHGAHESFVESCYDLEWQRSRRKEDIIQSGIFVKSRRAERELSAQV